jgi:anti-anti-sigma factor
MQTISTDIFESGNYTLSFSCNFKKEIYDDLLIEIVNTIEVDKKKAMYFKEILEADISRAHKNILVDVSACESIDTSFLGILVQANKKLKENNGSIKIIGLKISPDEIYRMSGFTKIFTVFTDKQSAIKSFGA